MDTRECWKEFCYLAKFQIPSFVKTQEQSVLKVGPFILQFIMQAQVIKLLFLPEHYQSNKAVHMYHVTDIMTNDTTEKLRGKLTGLIFSD